MEKVKALWHDIETWRFVAMVLLGVTVGLFVMANSVIEHTVQLTNDARLELYKMKYPPQEKSWALNTSQLEGFTWDLEAS